MLLVLPGFLRGKWEIFLPRTDLTASVSASVTTVGGMFWVKSFWPTKPALGAGEGISLFSCCFLRSYRRWVYLQKGPQCVLPHGLKSYKFYYNVKTMEFGEVCWMNNLKKTRIRFWPGDFLLNAAGNLKCQLPAAVCWRSTLVACRLRWECFQ